MINISDLSLENVDDFFTLFETIVKEDFPEYSDKVKNFFLTRDYSKQSFINLIGQRYRKVLIARESDEVVGYLVGDGTYGGVGFVSFFGVKKEKRKNGIGSALLKAYEEFCKSKKAHMIKLYTFDRIQPFYEKLEYEHIGEEKMGYWGTTNQVMGKRIGDWNEETLAM